MIDFTKENVLSNNRSTLKATSYDDANDCYLSESEFPAVDFDEVVKSYCKGFGLEGDALSSNDALVLFQTNPPKFIFVEFKNGYVDSKEKRKIRNKIDESLLVFSDIVDENVSFCRQNMNYVLVYNKMRNEDFENKKNSSFTKFAEVIAGKAKEKFVIEGFARNKIFFNDVKILNQDEFLVVTTSLENGTYSFS